MIRYWPRQAAYRIWQLPTRERRAAIEREPQEYRDNIRQYLTIWHEREAFARRRVLATVRGKDGKPLPGQPQWKGYRRESRQGGLDLPRTR